MLPPWAVERLLDALERAHARQPRRGRSPPSRSAAPAGCRAPLAPPRLSLLRNVEADAHAVETAARRSGRSRDLLLERATSAVTVVVDGRDRVLPEQRLLRDRAGRGSGRIGPMSRCVSLYQARANASANSSGLSWKRPRDRLVDGSTRSGEVGRQHRRRTRERSRSRGRAPCWRAAVLRLPLVGTRGALGELPLVAEQVLEELMVHCVGVEVHVTSMPLVMASRPLPEP